MAVNPAAAVETPHRLRPTHATNVHSSDVRIVFLTNIIAPYWKSIFDALSRRYGHMRVLLSTRMEPNRHWEVDWKDLDVAVQKTITLSRRWRHTSGFTEPIYLHFPLDTIKQLRSFKAQLVFSGEMGFRTLLALAYRKMHPNSRLVVWAEIAESTEQGRGWSRAVLRHFLQKNVDGFVVPGASGARYLRRLGTHDGKIFRVPYTTDIDRFAANPLARRDDNARSLLYVGQLIVRKGLLPFINLLSKWAGANPDRVIQFVLAGDGPLRNQLERTSVPPNLNLAFQGNVPYRDLPKLYAQAGIFVFPTLADTWGVVVNEALASGLPVLGSVRSQAVEELIEDGRNGWLFQPGNTEQMYNAIDRSLNTSVTALNTMRRHARATAIQLSPDYVADRVDAVVAHMTRTS